jgi:NAD(P)H-dependent FMN reductase
MLKLKVIVTSTRPGRVGLPIGEWFAEFAKEHGKFEVELVDLAEMKLPIFDEPNHPMSGEYVHDHTKAWSKVVADGDAFAFIMPEYNFFVPPSVVNALDYLHHEWKYKAAAIIGYGGASGGMRAGQALKPLLANLSIMPTNPSLYFRGFRQYLHDDGSFVPEAVQEETATHVLDELAKWAGALKPLREN